MEKAASAEIEEQPGECQSLNQMVVKKISEICRVVNQVKKNLQRVGVELPIIRWLRWEGTPGVCLVHLKAGPGWLGQQVESQLGGSKEKGLCLALSPPFLLSSLGCSNNKTYFF